MLSREKGAVSALCLKWQARASEKDLPVCGLLQAGDEPQQSRLACRQVPAQACSPYAYLLVQARQDVLFTTVPC